MWVTTPATFVWLLVPDSAPECGAVERAQGWASDHLGPSPCSTGKQLRVLRRVASCLWVQVLSCEGTRPEFPMANPHFLTFLGLLPAVAIHPKDQDPHSHLLARGCSCKASVVGHERGPLKKGRTGF